MSTHTKMYLAFGLC